MRQSLLSGASHPAMLHTPRAEAQPSIANVQSAVASLGTTFEAFKEKNDERLKEIENRGSADPILQETVDKINADLGQFSDQVDDIIKAQKNEQERIDKFEAAMNRGGLAGNQNPETDIRSEATVFYQAQLGDKFKPEAVNVEAYTAYKDAFFNYARRGERGVGSDVLNALQVGSDADGGFLVPASTSSKILKRMFETSEIRQHASVQIIGGDRWEQIIDTDDAVSGGMVSELASRPETGTPKLGLQEIYVHEQYANPAITQKMLDDSALNVENWLLEKIGDKLVRTENGELVNGNGVGTARGFMSYKDTAVATADASRSWGKVQQRNIGGTAGFKSDGNGADIFIKLEHDMKRVHRKGAVYAMNNTTLGLARLIKDSDGRYIWQMGNIQAGMPSTLNNYGIAEFEDMDDFTSGKYPLAFANFATGYLIVDRLGIRVLRDPYTGKPKILYYTTKRFGGDVVNFDAIKYGKASA